MTGHPLGTGPRVRRDCTCPTVRHVHGTAIAYKRDRCRCTPCTRAARDSERRRRLDVFTGAPSRRVPAGPVREHVIALQAQGLGYKRVAELAGVAGSTIFKIRYHDPGRADGLPQQHVARSTAERVFAVRAGLDVVTDGALLDATGTLRRLEALHARGWSRRTLAARLGVEPNGLRNIVLTGQASGRMVRAVRALYEELWDVAPPSSTPSERAAITRTLRWAREHGWVVPAAWDEETIDDPAAQPATAGDEGDDVLARLDELIFLAGMGEDLDRAARRLGWASWESAQHRAKHRGHRAHRLRAETPEVAA